MPVQTAWTVEHVIKWVSHRQVGLTVALRGSSHLSKTDLFTQGPKVVHTRPKGRSTSAQRRSNLASTFHRHDHLPY